MRFCKNKNGFTLVELLIVVAILAVLAAIAIPSIAGIIDRSRKASDEQNIKTMELAIETFASEARTYTSAKFDLPKVENVLSTINDGNTNYKELLKNYSDNKFSKDFYPTTPLGLITVIENYSSLRGTKITIPAETGTDFYYNVDTGLIIKEETGITDRQTLKTKLLEQREKDDLTGKWINITAVIGRAGDGGIDNRPADENFVKSYAGNDGGSISEKLAEFCYITTDGYIGLTDDYKGGLLPEKVVLPKYFQGIEVTGIRQYGFRNAVGIKHIVLAEGMTEIKTSAFSGSSIQFVEFSSTVSNVHQEAFSGCSNLKEIIIPNNNNHFSAIGNVLYNKNLTNIILLPGTTKYDVPDEVTTINYITNYISLKEFQIGKNVSSMNSHNVLRLISEIEIVTVHPENQYYCIENGILYNKDKTKIIRVLKDGAVGTVYNIPETVTSIDYGFLEDIEGCEILNIHKNVSSINEQAFLNSKTLKEINVDEQNNYFKSVNGILFNKSCTKLLKYPTQKIVDENLIPDSVTSYAYRCMEHCTFQGTFTFGSNVTKMDSQTFASCKNLTKVILNEKLSNFSLNGSGTIQTVVVNGPDTIISAILTNSNLNFVFNTTSNAVKIEDNIIYSKDGKTLYAILGNERDVIINEGVTRIAGYSIYNKTLKTLYIPSSVTTIEAQALGGSTAQKILFGFEQGKISGAYWGLTNSPTVQYNASRP